MRMITTRSTALRDPAGYSCYVFTPASLLPLRHCILVGSDYLPAMQRLSLLCLTLLTASCASKPQGWQQALHAPAGDMAAGAWTGTWKSDVNGHTGALACVITRTAPDRCTFHYRAGWAHVFSAGFQVECRVTPDGRVTGSKDLGTLYGGIFTHDGAFTGDRFQAQYKSRIDTGRMTMSRMRPSSYPAP